MNLHADAERWPLRIAVLALVAAMVLGGSGSMFPRPEIILQCLLAALGAAWVWNAAARTGPGHGLAAVPRGAWIIAALLLALPLCQLLPLPPAIWHSLPGRSAEMAALDLVGRLESWRPWSLTPNRTLAAALAMAAAAALLVMTAGQDRRGRSVLLAAVVGIALVSILLGAAQISGGDGNGFRFYHPDERFLDGFQTGHNGEADLFLTALVALAAAASDWTDARKPKIAASHLLGPVGVLSALLALGVILTASRTGIALLPVAIGAQLLILRHWLPSIRRRPAVVALVALAAVAVLAAGFTENAELARVIARFHTPTEFRPEIWQDAVFATQQYWPWGAGMGSFMPIFEAAERLEAVTGRLVNRAHDDYLELMIEAGLPGLLVLGLICRELVAGAVSGFKSRIKDGPDASVSRAQLICGIASLGILALHSLMDYPLRTMALACIAAVNGGLLLPGPGRSSPES